MKKIVTIAGSDSSGGAGIQADLKAITLLGAFGMSVVTALTAQNTQGVFDVLPVPAEFVAAQWDAVASDISVDAVKTGMLWDRDIITMVAAKLRKSSVPIKVLDPVMVAKSGSVLLRQDAIAAYIKELLPLATIVTPNIPEARMLSGRTIRTLEDVEKAAQDIHGLGAHAVVVKGGHRRGDATDILFDGKDIYHFPAPRMSTIHTHGTGCTFASALAVEVTRSESIPAAVEKAKKFITQAISYSVPLGKGRGPTNPYAVLARDAEIFRATQSLQAAVHLLSQNPVGPLIPEVQSNLGFAIPSGRTAEDVVAFPGRIVRLRDSITTVAPAEPGASRHIAHIILTVMTFNEEYRSAMNIRYEKDILRRCRRQPWVVREFDRKDEPKQIKAAEGSSLEWGVSSVLKRTSRIPDVIIDGGDIGKEPMIRVLGKNPEEVVRKVLCLL
ncbi:MAG TPA: bifunctional hydroxymethylpyrimidine kinase/phosphomethylpyrimidine kinase [Thermodesulfobacteriota bacterium]|nr:bifunctional hydroxymethylpyrimidine kinase/phosphomethylpyrimidine kinase [Thermodesulfobacteriota bacterium]HNU72628.1 bifunctional hydroxymethylpyrimidine kinase/phosphomethylpyrimidine kinase [Thermodesulfobacteriota bacterium]